MPNRNTPNQEYTVQNFIYSVMMGGGRLMTVILNDHPEFINAQNDLGQTALHIAINNAADGAPIRLLIERGIDLNIRDNAGRTALEFARMSDDGMFTDLIEECIIARGMTEMNLMGYQTTDNSAE